MKRFSKACLIGLAVTLVGMAINLIAALTDHILPLAFTMYGGEIIIDMGFGIRASAIYAMDRFGGVSKSISFDPFTFVLSFVLFTLAAQIVLFIVAKVRKK